MLAYTAGRVPIRVARGSSIPVTISELVKQEGDGIILERTDDGDFKIVPAKGSRCRNG